MLAGRIYKNPIEALYMMSALITLTTRTPEFLDKDAYFPMNRVFEDPENFKALKEEVENILEKTGGLNRLNLFILRLACNSKIVKDEIKKTEIQVKNE